MATGMRLAGAGLVGGRLAYAAETLDNGAGTEDTPELLGAVTAAAVVGDSRGFTVSTAGTMTATFPGTRLCRIQALVEMEAEDAAALNAALAVVVNNVEVAGSDTAEQDIDTTGDPILFEVDHTMLISNGDVVAIGAINGTNATKDIVIIVNKDRTGTIANQGPASGWFQITG